ncbi:MAG: flagellar M-ring protein FliF [Candidatus Delongbacteria bacterium]|nr:flagellar M-ring protein FliF [Candidatus Delongbacteria bacterium]
MQETLIKILNQIKEIWKRLSKIQQISIISLLGILILSFILLLVWSNTTSYKLLYSNLSLEDSEKISEYLKSKKVDFRSEGGGSIIYVDDRFRDELRIEISDHFPKFDLKGWELFDKTNLGLTDFTQKINFKRALEGELARTLNAYEQIKFSRVFLSLPEKSLFVEEDKDPTAAVNIMLKNPRMGAGKELVSSITLLIARSVEGLKPENVVVSDFYGNLLSEEVGDDPLARISNTQMKLKRQLEERLELQAQSMLDRMLGKGNAIVRVSAELNFDQINRHIESYQPDTTATRSEERNDEKTGETESVEHSITNYEINRRIENIVKSVGSIARLTVSVTLNHKIGTNGELQPHSAQEVGAIEQVIKNAVGFDQERDDQIAVASYPFDTSVMDRELASIEKEERQAMILAIAKRLIIVLVLIFIIFFLRNMIKQFADKYLKTEEVKAAALEEQPIIEPELLELKKRKEEFLNQVISLSETTPEDIAHLLRTWLVEDLKSGE